MADFDELMKEFEIDLSEEPAKKPSGKKKKPFEKKENDSFKYEKTFYNERTSSGEKNPDFSSGGMGTGQMGVGQMGSGQTGFGQMSGVFGSGSPSGNPAGNPSGQRAGRTARGGRRTRGHSVNGAGIGQRLRNLPYAVIICTVVSICMGIHVICNFDEVTWAIFQVIYKLISAGLLIFFLVVIVLALILAIRRRSR